MTLFFVQSPLFPIFFLLGSLCLTSCSAALLHLGKFKSKELLRSRHPPKFFFHSILKRFARHHEWQNLYFCISSSKHIYELAYAITSFFFLISTLTFFQGLMDGAAVREDLLHLATLSSLIIAFYIFLDFSMRLIGSLWSKPVLKIAAPIASVYLLLLSFLTIPLLKLTRSLAAKFSTEEEGEALTDKTKIREMLMESDLQPHLDLADQKLIGSFLSFKERVAKEIMVPRVDIFSLPASTPIREAAPLMAAEGFSRIPIYKETLDQIVGLVLYKDLLSHFTSSQPLSEIAKPVLYVPENKKIAQLLQEFRSQQIHLAIVVDEYGGTEGIATIEDILEELVGEIEDESDSTTDRNFIDLPGGGWLVDAKMTLIDIENHLGVIIPQSPEYETLGGYVFHCAGTIPLKGWKLSHDNFDLEVISSNERALEKITIIPRAKLTLSN